MDDNDWWGDIHKKTVFSGVAWCKKRGLDKNKEFLAENIQILRDTVQLR